MSSVFIARVYKVDFAALPYDSTEFNRLVSELQSVCEYDDDIVNSLDEWGVCWEFGKEGLHRIIAEQKESGGSQDLVEFCQTILDLGDPDLDYVRVECD